MSPLWDGRKRPMGLPPQTQGEFERPATTKERGPTEQHDCALMSATTKEF